MAQRIKIKTPEQLEELLNWSLKDAPILSTDLGDKYTEIYDSLESSFTVTDEGNLSDDPDSLDTAVSPKIAQYLFANYEQILVTPEELLVGMKDGEEIELLDGKDRKLYLDAGML